MKSTQKLSKKEARTVTVCCDAGFSVSVPDGVRHVVCVKCGKECELKEVKPE